jgi:TolB protein
MKRFALGLSLLVLLSLGCDECKPFEVCPDDANPSVDVPPSFEGIIQVDVQSFGADIPENFTAWVGIETSALLARGGSHRFTVASGTYDVRLTVPANCTVAPQHPRSVTVAARETKLESFRVDCVSDYGTVQAEVQTFGRQDLATQYRVQLAGMSQDVSINGYVVFSGVPTGPQDVQLLAVPSGCTVATPNPVRVTVLFRATSVARFDVVCAGTPGELRVETLTTGSSIDMDGYTLQVTGPTPPPINNPIGTTDSRTISNLQPADYRVELGGVAANCEVDTSLLPNPRIVAVNSAPPPSVTRFGITCYANRGSVEVRTLTTGDAPDPNGYTVQIGQNQQTINRNGTYTFAALPAGRVDVTLSGVASNCGVGFTNPRSATVTAGATTTVVFEVACPGPTPLIVFESDRSGDRDVWVMDPTGMGAVNLSKNGADDDDPSWSWDNTRIVFRSTRSGQSAIWVMNADGTNPRQLTSAGANDGNPAFSPDGSKIAFERRVSDGYAQIFVMNANGDSLRQLTNVPGRSSEGPVFSPDGTQIVFKSERINGQDDVFLMNADGSQQSPLTGPLSEDFDPAWSPDGKTIIFSTDREGFETLYIMDALGNNERQFVVPAQFSDFNPAFSTDGRQVVFTREGNVSTRAELWLVNVTGALGLFRLTNNTDWDDDAEFKKPVPGGP